jgi:uncharacterized membrane protein
VADQSQIEEAAEECREVRYRHHRREAGQVMPVVALLILVITGFCALTVDAGMGYNEQRGDQNAADASGDAQL